VHVGGLFHALNRPIATMPTTPFNHANPSRTLFDSPADASKRHINPVANVPSELTREIQQLEAALSYMGAAVETRVATALEAWFSWDADLARSIRQADDEIDRMDVEIEERCMQILALHQPVASDLRTVLAVLRIVTNLERGADLARSIAKRVIKLSNTPASTQPPAEPLSAHEDTEHPDTHEPLTASTPSPRPGSARVEPPDVVLTMGEGVVEMLREAMLAFDKGDIERARAVRRRDLHIDELNRTVFRWAVDGTQRDPERTEGYFGTIVMARALERIGDMAANIAEDIIFAVGGSVVRHSPI
jgi:phosphate transport system protein